MAAVAWEFAPSVTGGTTSDFAEEETGAVGAGEDGAEVEVTGKGLSALASTVTGAVTAAAGWCVIAGRATSPLMMRPAIGSFRRPSTSGASASVRGCNALNTIFGWASFGSKLIRVM